MKRIWIIFKKEMKDVLRDRRTLILMVIMPLVLFPLIINLSTKFTLKQKKSAQEKILKVGIVFNGNNPEFEKYIDKRNDMTYKIVKNEVEIEPMINSKKLDFGIVFDKDFDIRVSNFQEGNIRVYYRSTTEIEIAKKRIDIVIKDFNNTLLENRFTKLGLDKKIIRVVKVTDKDIASFKEKFGEKLGGFIPYLFVIFSFLGAMYPAIDLGAGEKERGTIETLLVSPASRFQIVAGKFGVVTAAGIISAFLTFLGLYITIRLNSEIPNDILQLILKIINVKSIIIVFSMIIPLSIFFAGVLLSFSVFAHSFKEAQSIMTPLNIAIIIPAFIGTLPGIKLDPVTALIPILNVSLASKEVISGTIRNFLLFEVFLSLILLAGISLIFCVKWFNRESVIFRES